MCCDKVADKNSKTKKVLSLFQYLITRELFLWRELEWQRFRSLELKNRFFELFFEGVVNWQLLFWGNQFFFKSLKRHLAHIERVILMPRRCNIACCQGRGSQHALKESPKRIATRRKCPSRTCSGNASNVHLEMFQI